MAIATETQSVLAHRPFYGSHVTQQAMSETEKPSQQQQPSFLRSLWLSCLCWKQWRRAAAIASCHK